MREEAHESDAVQDRQENLSAEAPHKQASLRRKQGGFLGLLALLLIGLGLATLIATQGIKLSRKFFESNLKSATQTGTSFEAAVKSFDTNRVQYLLTHKNGEISQLQKQAALMWAARTGDATLAGILLNHGADAAQTVNEDLKLVMLKHGYRIFRSDAMINMSPLHICAMSAHGLRVPRCPGWNYPSLVRLLVEHGADVNARDKWDQTPLHLTEVNNLTHTLLALGADVRLRDQWGRTPLHNAAANWVTFRHCEAAAGIVSALINAGAEINAVNEKGRTPLHYAAANEYGNNDDITRLLDAGAEVNAQDKEGRTALHWAAIENRTDIMQLLLKHGAQPGLEDQDGKTADDLLLSPFPSEEPWD